MDKMVDDGMKNRIHQQALKFLKDNGGLSQLNNELGNMIIYVMLEELLDAPKVFYQIEIATNGTLTNGGGIHILDLKSDTENRKIIFSKSSLAGNLNDAIDKAFETVVKAKDADVKTLSLFEPTILEKYNDASDATKAYLTSILIPNKRDKEKEVDNAFGIFLGYDIGLGAGFSISDAEAKMVADIQACVPHIQNKITELGLSNYPFYFYVIPFNNIDSDKNTIMTSVGGGSS
jgi:hypothetical protein